jgi:hypothetical protein
VHVESLARLTLHSPVINNSASDPATSESTSRLRKLVKESGVIAAGAADVRFAFLGRLAERALNQAHDYCVMRRFVGHCRTCQRLNRRACLIELDPRYVDVICQRWRQYSGKPAIREADGRAFAKVEKNTPRTGVHR